MTLTKELLAVLNVTGLAKSDNRLYQVLNSLVTNLARVEDRLALVAATASSASTASSGAITQLTGHVFATGPGSVVSTLSTTGVVAGTYGSSTGIPIITVNTYGRLTSATTTAFNTGSGITVLTGDVFATGPGAVVSTLSTTGVVAGTYGGTLTIPILSIDAKGRVTTATTTTFTTGGGGGSGAWTLISQVRTTGTQASVDFTSIPGTYSTLKIIWMLQTTIANSASNIIRLRLNGDTTAANYNSSQLGGAQNTITVSSQVAASTTGVMIGAASGNTGAPTTGAAGSGEITLVGYTTASLKGILAITDYHSTVTGITALIISSRYISTAAITQATLFTDGTAFMDDGLVTLYGVS